MENEKEIIRRVVEYVDARMLVLGANRGINFKRLNELKMIRAIVTGTEKPFSFDPVAAKKESDARAVQVKTVSEPEPEDDEEEEEKPAPKKKAKGKAKKEEPVDEEEE